MAEHDPLRFACGPRGVDQDAALVGSLAVDDVIHSFLRNIQTLFHELLPLSKNSNMQHHSLSSALSLVPPTSWGVRWTYRVKIRDLLLGLPTVLHYGFQMGQFVTDLQKSEVRNSPQPMLFVGVKTFIYLSNCTCRIFSNCFWFSTTMMLALESLATYWQASGEFVA